MKKSSQLNGDFEYELFDENQQDTALREKLTVLYSTPFADILWWELHDLSLMNNACHKLYYYEQNILKHVILFKFSAQAPKKIIVINREYKIYIKHIENICHVLFNEFGKVQQIAFEYIFDSDPKPSSKMVCEQTSNDVIINLPKSMNNYMMKTLGKRTRKLIKSSIDRISKDFSEFGVHYFEKSDISFEQIEKVASLNRERMKTKGIKSNLTDTKSKMMHQYVSMSGFGFLCVCTIDGKIVGGQINTIIEDHAYAHVIGHDNLYNKYSIGQIVMINAIKYLIEKNIKYYHFLSGPQEYKYRLGGISHFLYTVRVFRNYNINYFLSKSICSYRNSYRKFRRKLKTNKTIFHFFLKMKKMETKIRVYCIDHIHIQQYK